ncbi:MAG: hybrid sensor histidine kinase/response regulator, partial [Spirochaetales bacterium]|nr:hybrid sensor histidine kinase/response regulator [Spirochaetales bacterium]
IINVRDSGTGIAKEILTRIFDPMFTTKSVNEGTGLGLTIVHNIITGDFSGEIDVQSEVSRGTTFCLKIPAAPPGDNGG